MFKHSLHRGGHVPLIISTDEQARIFEVNTAKKARERGEGGSGGGGSGE